ncbi:MAG TPA: DNA internalization-related competence protein ComEC/Rec2, partial [Candidatus Acidoferrales bacterium]|nr:DNA internalization-related competence protein ComEC/Rec2 [Candidatus Acidoferrales bacterium]
VDRQRHLLASLAAAAILTVVGNPGASLDISFQLSFVAVLGLTLAMQAFWPWWREREEEWLLRLRPGWRARLARPIAVYIVVSISALLATSPLTALHFNQVSLMAPVANAVVVPLLGSLAVVLGLVAALLVPIVPAIAAAIAVVAGLVVHVGCWLAQGCAVLPGAALRVVTPTRFELGLMYAAMLTAVVCKGSQRRLLLVGIVTLAIGDAAWWWRERYAHRDLRLTFLSVGQGDCSVIELPGGKVALVDGAGIGDGSFDVGERVIAPYLWSRKIARVDFIILSHPQWDHYGGLQFIVDHFAPREFWWNGTGASARHFKDLMKAVEAHNVLTVPVRRGYRRDIDGVELAVLSPPEAAAGWSINDLSVVLQVSFGAHRVLFTGDIEAPTESYLTNTAGNELRSDVLKVPHHGSRTSSTKGFVGFVAPQFAVISLGFDNRFHFPNRDVVERYHRGGSKIVRTDTDGALELRLEADSQTQVDGDRWPALFHVR